jgi:hypothetical protein
MSYRVTLNVDAMRVQARRSRATQVRDAARWRRRSGVAPGTAVRAPKGLPVAICAASGAPTKTGKKG